MKKVTAFTLACFLVGASTVSAQTTANAACTPQQAINKLTTVTTAMSAGKIASDKVGAASQELNNAGSLLAKGDYAGACAIYDKLIKDHNLPLNPATK